MRLIDADALIAKYDAMHVGAPGRARNLIVDAPTVNDWISVKDRLPEVGKVVLAFGTRSATTGMFQGVGARNDLWWWKGHTIKHVSYWMPLPEPPKEDDDAEQ